MPSKDIVISDTEYDGDELQYWANKEAHELAPEVMNRVADYRKAIDENGMLDLWRLVYCTYYNLDYDASGHAGSQVQFAGDVGEIVLARVGHMRSIVQYLLVTTTAHRLNYTPRAVNTDYKSKAQVYAAKSLLDYYEREKRLGREHKSTAERSLLYGIGYLWQNWDPAAGREYMPDVDDQGQETGDMINEGDIVAEAKSPVDVICDLGRKPSKQEWYIVRETANKYNLAAKYRDPERLDLERAIVKSEPLGEEEVPRLFEKGFGGPVEGLTVESDDIDVFHFYHKRTDAVPNGRYCVVIGSDLWLYDGPLPYQDMPVHHMYPMEFLETAWGYSSAFDLVSNDELYNGLISTMWTLIDAFGVPNVFMEEGGDLGVEEVSGSLNLIRYPRGTQPPQVANMLDIPKALPELLEILQKNGELRSGVNATARGGTDSSVKSGVHAALMNAQALHFNSGLEQSFIALIEDSGTALVRIFKEHATVPRMLQVVGETGKGPVREFTQDNVMDIDRVIVDAGNPLERTIAGKESMARALLEMGLIKDPEYYFEVLNTGRMDSVYRSEQITTDTISRENELLASGRVNIIQRSDTGNDGTEHERTVVKEVPVLPSDKHDLHVERHLDEAGSPEARNNSELLKVMFAHVHDHLWQKKFGNQALVMITNPPPMPPEGGPPGGGNGPPKEMPNLALPPGTPMGEKMDLPGMPGMPAAPVPGQGPGPV